MAKLILEIPTLENLRVVWDEHRKSGEKRPYVLETLGRTARLLEDHQNADDYLALTFDHMRSVAQEFIDKCGNPPVDFILRAGVMQRIRRATNVEYWFERAALGEVHQHNEVDELTPFFRREAAGMAKVLGVKNPGLDTFFETSKDDLPDAAVAIIDRGDLEPAYRVLGKLEADLVNERRGPHLPDLSYLNTRMWDWWEELQQLINASKGNPPLTIPQVREMMVDVYERELSKRKDKRAKRPEWNCDFTKPLDIDVQPPFQKAPPARISVHVPNREGFDPEVWLYINTTGEAWEEMGFLRIIERGDEYEPQFVDRVPGSPDEQGRCS